MSNNEANAIGNFIEQLNNLKMKGIILQLSTGKEISYKAWDNELLQDMTYFVNIDAANNIEVKEGDEVIFEFITVDKKTTGIITGFVKKNDPQIKHEDKIASYYFLKTEAKEIADEQEKIALDNDVIFFETLQEKENFIQGFISGACWQKGRGDAKCVDFLEFIREKGWVLHKKMNRWFMHGDENLTSKELFAEYDKSIGINKQIIMTTKVRAIEILGKYESLMLFDKSVTDLFPVAKKCALLAIDEIISQQWLDVGIDYWNEVKSEIEKL